MKKILLSIFALIITIAYPISAFAVDKPVTINKTDEYVEYYEDGSYAITSEQTSTGLKTATSTVTKTKSTDYYNSNDQKQWTVSVVGTFTYTGSSATCTKSTTNYKIYNDKWKVTKSEASKNGRQAIGEFTIKYYALGIATKTINKTLTISCSNTGTIS